MKQTKKNVSANPVAIVTGGNSGIGEATARVLAKHNYTVVVAGRRQSENQRVAKAIAESGKADPIRADVSKEADCLELIKGTVKQYGRLDLLVNNAGTGGMGPILETSTEQMEKVMRTNLYSAYWCSREAIRIMAKQDQGSACQLRGRIINIASILGVEAWEGTALYSMSKHGMMGLTRALADECAEKLIRVAAICPAMVATPMTEVSGPEYIAPEDIAGTVAYLLGLSPAAWPTEIVLPRRGAD